MNNKILYRINNFAVVDRDDELGEMGDIGLPLSDVATFGLRDTMVAGGGIIDHPDIPPFTTLTTRDYCGNYIYRNGTLERILTPTGYIEGDTLHHYIKDYQGNVRCVVRHDGTLVESNEYYPYGGLFSATASTQPYKYGAKELDRTNGLDLYDSEARWYDSLLGRTTTMDPLAEKYYSLSPYLWCAGNPVKNVDLHGDTVAVLHEFMHIALLVQENDKWSYYSVNGNNVYISGSVSNSSRNDSGSFFGRKKFNDEGEMTFDSFQSFFYDESNTENTYKEAYIIYTSDHEDQLIVQTFKKIAKTDYSLFSNNCATAVAKSLESAGIKTNIPFTNVISYYPSYLFNSIIINNRGKHIYK